MVIFLCLSLGFQKTDPRRRIWMQVIYLGDDARKHSEGVGRWDREGRKANKGFDHEQVTAGGNGGSASLWDLWKTMWNRQHNSPAKERGNWLRIFPRAGCPSTLPAPCESWACSYCQKMPSRGDAGSCHPTESCLQVTAGVSQGVWARHRACVRPICCLRTSLPSTTLFPISSLFISVYPGWNPQFSLPNN